MATLPFTSLSASDQGLFTPAELRSLMEKELSRSRRYGYDVVMLSIGVDRIASLGDLYGHESKGLVLEEITRLLIASTRSCDFLGCLLGDRILALFPHTGEPGAKAVANRLVTAARDLEFTAGGPQISVTLTVGIAAPRIAEEHELEPLVEQANSACQEGQDAGGDRWQLKEPAKNGHDKHAPALSDSSDMGALMDDMLHEKMKAIFQSMGEELPDLAGRDSEVFALALKKMAQDRKSQDSKLEVLERRIERLSHNLGLTEEQLQRAMEMKGIDPGVASIYQEVQGIADGDSDQTLKKDMMAAIYEANMELQNKTESEQDD
ncbi:MAG: GGDEF domain-containing protein [Planctomycetes bacterium]|nr:GGDEF domain-containing protein [Planctomycetota bacterium]